MTTLTENDVYDALVQAQQHFRTNPDQLVVRDADGFVIHTAPDFNKVSIESFDESVEASVLVKEDAYGDPSDERGIYFDVLINRGIVRVHGRALGGGATSQDTFVAGELARTILAQAGLEHLPITEIAAAHMVFPGQSVMDQGQVRTVQQVRSWYSEDDAKVLTEVLFAGGGGVILWAHHPMDRIIAS